jgi:hypothetical protein
VLRKRLLLSVIPASALFYFSVLQLISGSFTIHLKVLEISEGANLQTHLSFQVKNFLQNIKKGTMDENQKKGPPLF